LFIAIGERRLSGLVRIDVIANVLAVAICSAGIALGIGGVRAHTMRPRVGASETGEQIYRTTCVGCHGSDGRGAPKSTVGFDVPLPDFTDCNFASREASSDWTAIVRDGGPVRGLTRIMPAFRDLLTPEQIKSVIGYVQHFCNDNRWPRGELNVPLASITEKAFPEDEIVLTSAVNTRGPASIENHAILEKRFGARDQLELDVPFGFVQRPGHSWAGGLGDLSVAEKHVFASSLGSGRIVSALGGFVLPTAGQSVELGSGTTSFEAFLLGAQLLPAQSFLQVQGGAEIPFDRSRATPSVAWSAALGTTVPFSQITRIWSPMLEIAGTRDLTSGAPVMWNVVPQFQISLSALQHVRAGVGVDIPLTQRDSRSTELRVYMLWDTFDGPLFSGWKGWCPGCQH
jgi:mono/diheme cytochrome c family protein